MSGISSIHLQSAIQVGLLPFSTFETRITTIWVSLETESSKNEEEGFTILEQAYADLPKLKPQSPKEVRAAIELEAHIVGRYGFRFYRSSFEKAAFYSELAIHRLMNDETKFSPRYEKLDKEAVHHPNEISQNFNNHPDNLKKFIMTLDDKHKMSIFESYYTLGRCLEHLIEYSGLKKSVPVEKVLIDKIALTFYDLAEVALRGIEQPSEKVKEKIKFYVGELQYNIFSKRVLEEILEANKAGNKLVPLEQFPQYAQSLDKAKKYNDSAEMHARIANRKFYKFKDHVMGKDASKWGPSEIEQGRKYIIEAITSWEKIFVKITTYEEADQQLFHELLCSVNGNYFSLLSKTGTTDPERTATHIEYCLDYYKKNPEHPYNLIHILSLSKFYLRVGQLEEAKNWIIKFDVLVVKHLTLVHVGNYMEACKLIKQEYEIELKKRAEA